MTATAPNQPTTLHDWAQHYAARGFELFPVDPASKAPLVKHGFNDASSDPATVGAYWTSHPNALLGCRIPSEYIVLDIDPRHNGHDTWRALEESYAPIHVTREHRSGRGDGGRHVWFQRPDGPLSTKQLNEWARRNNVGHATGKRNWTSGIDLLHHDLRYTILPPSLHPETQLPYTWTLKGDPGPLPGFLADLIVTQPAQPAVRSQSLRPADDDSIADWYSSTATWNEILDPAGWVLVSGTGDDDGSKWRHPNATADSSCSIKYGCLFVYTPNTDFEATEGSSTHGYTRFRAWATLEHGGDLSAAARQARDMRDGGFNLPAVVTLSRDQSEEWGDPIPLGEAHDTPPFPVDVLPTWISDYVTAVAAEMQVAVDLPAVLSLVTLSVANAGRYKVAITRGWNEPVNIYAVVALPPSAGKSPVVSKLLGPVHAHELNERRDLEQRLEHVTQKRRITTKAMQRAEDKGDVHEAQRHLQDLLDNPLPIVPRYIADDATPEALAVLMHEQGGRLALISTEGGPFDIMAGRYSDRANLDLYLKAWGGDQLRVDRIGRPSIVIPNPLLTLGLTVQPHVLTALADKDEFKGRGLTARIMYSVPPDFVGYRNLANIVEPHPELKERYDRFMMSMLQPALQPEATLLPFDETARALFLGWRQSLEERRRPDGDLRPMAEWSTKLESTVARVAGLLAIAEGSDTVDGHYVTRAVTIGNYWLAHAKIVHDMWQVDETVAHARAIIEWVRLRGLDQFSIRDLNRGLRVRFPTAESTRDPLQLLTERGWIRPLFDGPLVTGRRGKESPTFAVHPLCPGDNSTHVNHVNHVPKDVFLGHSLTLSGDPETRDTGHGGHGGHELSDPDDDLF